MFLVTVPLHQHQLALEQLNRGHAHHLGPNNKLQFANFSMAGLVTGVHLTLANTPISAQTAGVGTQSQHVVEEPDPR